jgi:hypothetical protein
MSDWKVIGKYDWGGSRMAQLMTLGTSDPWYTYMLEHVNTGEEKRVVAQDGYELGEKIADGDWEEELDD